MHSRITARHVSRSSRGHSSTDSHSVSWKIRFGSMHSHAFAQHELLAAAMLRRGSETALRGVFFVLVFASAIAQQPNVPPVPPVTSTRSIRISFVPPPLEGTISLGIYNDWDQLVRVLHQESQLDEFTVGPDALITTWDGKDEFGYDLPAGTYSARGFIVAPVKIQEVPAKETPPERLDPVRLRLVANPLEKNDRPTVELLAGFDDENAYIST